VVDQETSPAPTLERRRSALALLCAASFLAVVDTTIVSIALPSIRRVMGFSAGGSQWVLNAYALVFGGLLLLFGRLGDRVGRRRMFLFGLIVFLAGSVLAGVATQPWMLLGAESFRDSAPQLSCRARCTLPSTPRCSQYESGTKVARFTPHRRIYLVNANGTHPLGNTEFAEAVWRAANPPQQLAG
jgi:hypothetical protein